MDYSREGLNHTYGPMEDLRVSLDPRTLDIATGKRRLQSIEDDGTLIYDEPRDPESRLTEMLGRIWQEYPGGMLDITEEELERREVDENDTEDHTEKPSIDKQDDKGMIMSFEDMTQMRETILAQLNQSRNELWFVLELAKTLKESSSFTTNPPPPPSLLPQAAKQAQKPKPVPPPIPPAQSSTYNDPLVLPPGTFSTTPSVSAQKPILTEVLELETALAAKQAALEQCGQMIDSAVDELTNMTSASDAFWTDIRRLNEGIKGRGQWAVVPKPDFGRVSDGQKAKDVIIPYAIDEASASIRARSLAAFDLDPKKKELTFGARSYLRLRVEITGDDGITHESTVPKPLPHDADVGERMEEAQLESFDEELFAEIRAEIMKRGGGIIEPQSVQFEMGGYTLHMSLVDIRNQTDNPPKDSQSSRCNLIIHSTRLTLLQLLRARKRRLTSVNSSSQPLRAPSLLAPLAQLLQHGETTDKISLALGTLNRTLRSAGIQSSIIDRPSGDKPETVGRLMDDGSLEHTGSITTLEIPGCPGIMMQILPASQPLINTSKASFSVSDSAEILPILSGAAASQLLHVVLNVVKANAGESKDQIYLDEMEDLVSLGERGTLSLSIPPPWDALHAKVEGRQEAAFDSRRQASLFDWARDIMSEDMEVS